MGAFSNSTKQMGYVPRAEARYPAARRLGRKFSYPLVNGSIGLKTTSVKGSLIMIVCRVR
jgi:hypothetical protein